MNPNIVQLMQDPELFGPYFEGDSWDTWRTFLKALFALEMSAKELEEFTKFTNRDTPPEDVKEGWLIVGRRGGKSLISGLVAVFLACFRDYRTYLAPGEVATIMVIAADRRQARTVLRYINGFFEIPLLNKLIKRKTKEGLELTNRVAIEIHTASYRTTRGYTLAAVIADEVAFWRSDDSANPDTEILNGLRPGMTTIPGALLLSIGTPYSRRGEMWKTFKSYYGQDGSILVWKAPTRAMNPSVPEEFIEKEYDRDSAAAAAEYGAEFRRDLEGYIDVTVLESCTAPDRHELPPVEQTYFAFTDPSGGSRDSFTLAICHREKDRVVLDCIRERRPPFSPEGVVKEFSKLLKSYHVNKVTGDRYAGEWPREQFRKCGIEYKTSDKSKSELYVELLPLLNSNQVELLDNSRLLAQFSALERRTSRAGKDSIDHPPGGHDDLSNAVAGAVVNAAEKRTVDYSRINLNFGYGGPSKWGERPARKEQGFSLAG